MSIATVRICIREDADQNADSIEIAAREYVAQLLADLALPVQAELSVVVYGEGLPECSFSVAIDKHPPKVLTIAGKSIGASIPLALYAQRRRFVSDEVVATYAAQRWPEAQSAEVLAKVGELIEALVDRNIGLKRVAEFLPNLSAPWKVFEMLSKIHTDDTVAITVAGASAEVARAWKNLQERVFRATGLLCPIPISVENELLAVGEYQVRVNDVHLPVQVVARGAKLEDDLVPFVEHSILRTRLALVTCDSVRRRVEFVGKEAPVLADQVTTRVGIEQLWIYFTSLVTSGVPLLDFRRLLELAILRAARFRPDPQSLVPTASRSSVPAS